VTPELLAHVKASEGLRLTRYADPVGLATIGYGHLLGPDSSLQHVTESEAEALLRLDLQRAREAAVRLSPVLMAEPAPRLDAITDFVFNFGAGKYGGSVLRLCVNRKLWDEAAAQMRLWVHGRIGGKMVVLPGLMTRREVTARWLEHPIDTVLPPAA
jgi:lysozyme